MPISPKRRQTSGRRPYDCTLKLWDLASCREVRTLSGHANWVSAVAVTPDGERAISASRDKTLKLWDLETGVCLAPFAADHGLYCCAVDSDARKFVCGDASGCIHFLSLREPQIN